MEQIRYIRREDVEDARWDERIERSGNGMVYGFSWYLDIVAYGKWDALVLGDYEAIMPLCWNRKILGIKQVYMPVLTQQLGVFADNLSEEMVRFFINAIPSHFKRVHLHFHHHGAAAYSQFPFVERTNYVLDINRSEEQIKLDYKRDLKRSLKQTQDLKILDQGDVAEMLELYKKNLFQKNVHVQIDYAMLNKLLTAALERGKAKIYTVYASDEIVAEGVFLVSGGRVTNICGAGNQKARDLFANHAMLNQVIMENAIKCQYFDFEGSEIPGVKTFFERFGAINQPYFVYSDNRLPKFVTYLMKKFMS